jgi:ribosome modulation factor
MADPSADDMIHAAGYTAGRDRTQMAIDCPYLPGSEPAERRRWLAGFSEARVAWPPERDDDLPAPVPTPHAG